MRQPMSTPHGVGNHGVIGGQYAADGQAVAVVGVGHEGTGHGHGQLHRNFHLMDSTLLDVLGTEYGVFFALDQGDVAVGRG